jgi:hypothetical protein
MKKMLLLNNGHLYFISEDYYFLIAISVAITNRNHKTYFTKNVASKQFAKKNFCTGREY